jgi:CRISP-associated protein Cas1
MPPSSLAHKQLISILNTYESQTKISLLNDNIVISRQDTANISYPLTKIHTVLIIGDITLTTPLINKCLHTRTSIVLTDFGGRHIYTIAPSIHNLDLKKHQLLGTDKLIYAQQIVYDKTLNQLTLLTKRKHKLNQKIVLEEIKKKIYDCPDINSLMGIEGSLASKYYKLIFSPIPWTFRKPRSKHDVPNALLDMGYMRLYYITESILSTFGFDPYIGYLHSDYMQRKSLVCDLMEPFRPLVDNILLNLYARKQIKTDDFKLVDSKYIPKDAITYQKYSSYFLKALSSSTVDIHSYISKLSTQILKNKK